MDALAHSAKGERPPQTYHDHVSGVRALAAQYAAEAGQFAPQMRSALLAVGNAAAAVHDLGKLGGENQAVLRQTGSQRHLPVPHQDAGAAWLVQANALLAALLVQYHHKGLCNMTDESTEDKPFCRDRDAQTRAKTEQELDELTRLHQVTDALPAPQANIDIPGDMSMFLRMAFSCLADADHTDTSRHFGQYPAQPEMPALRAAERLQRLQDHMTQLAQTSVSSTDAERSTLRQALYQACRTDAGTYPFSACDAPVGSGKTTAIMANLLCQAQRAGARRIFVILPFTSIISQSVKVYRECLTLPGEDPQQVVGEVHHRADFQNRDTRCLTSLWRAPIVVTTAVAFFETLASNRPAALRRLHELPGSMVFVDEAHAALPARLMPLAWHWMNVLAHEWGCKWVLASGSLARFWTLDAFSADRACVHELVSDDLRSRLLTYERHRVTFEWAVTPKHRGEMVAWVCAHPGPRLLIVNTVKTAAVLAEDFKNALGRKNVEHLSTALTAEDREKTIARVIRRLHDPLDTNWTLVATSCVEAGIDISFRTGFREICSLMSLLQTAGRVNRSGTESDAQVWSFALQDDSTLSRNDQMRASIAVLNRYLRGSVPICPELCTRAMRDELAQSDGKLRKSGALCDAERENEFRTVAEEFVVIDSDTVVVIPDGQIADQVRAGQADWRLIQRHSVSIPRSRVYNLHLPELAPDVFAWSKAYDDFIGYMAGMPR